MFSLLATAQGGGITGDELLNASLAGYFVPFRSAQFKALIRRRESLAFGMTLWAQVFSQCHPKLIITIDQHTTRGLIRILNAKYRGAPTREEFRIEWGEYKADVFTYESVVMLRLPHLSRFPIFGREKSQSCVDAIIEATASHLRGQSQGPAARAGSSIT